MDWAQFLTLVGSMLAGIFVFYQITKQEISIIREQINTMNTHHREDMGRMDEKWERLFEKLLIKEQGK